MLTKTTGPALATSPLTRSVQALRDVACPRPRRGGWRDALGPAAAADAARMAVVALLDALLRLLSEFVAAREQQDGVVAGLAPCASEAARAGHDVLDVADTDGAGATCDPMPAIATSHPPRARRAFSSRPTHLAVPLIAAPLPRRPIAMPPPSVSPPHAALAHVNQGRAGYRSISSIRTRSMLSIPRHWHYLFVTIG